jgi:hypothetical protein
MPSVPAHRRAIYPLREFLSPLRFPVRPTASHHIVPWHSRRIHMYVPLVRRPHPHLYLPRSLSLAGPEVASSFSYLPGIRLPPQASLRRSGRPTYPSPPLSVLALSPIQACLPSPTRAQSARGNTRSRSSRRHRVTDPPISCRAPPSSLQWCNTIRGGVCTRPRQATRDAGSELTSPRRRVTWQRTPLDRRNNGARPEDGVLRLGLPGRERPVFGAYPACRLTMAAPRSFPVSCLARQHDSWWPHPADTHLRRLYPRDSTVTNPSSVASPSALTPHGARSHSRTAGRRFYGAPRQRSAHGYSGMEESQARDRGASRVQWAGQGRSG